MFYSFTRKKNPIKFVTKAYFTKYFIRIVLSITTLSKTTHTTQTWPSAVVIKNLD